VRTAIDTSVISALWSKEAQANDIAVRLDEVHAKGGLVICGPVYVELRAHPSANQRFVDDFLAEMGVAVDFSLTEPVWRHTANSFNVYAQRRRQSGGGTPKRLLVDFVIASHALLSADQLMTLDPARYRQDFSKLRII
jgi:predicted nucleic acid-binding protein